MLRTLNITERFFEEFPRLKYPKIRVEESYDELLFRSFASSSYLSWIKTT